MKTLKTIFALIAVFSFFTTPLTAQGSSELQKIQFTKTGSRLVVQIEVPGLLQYKNFSLTNPNRFVVDLYQVKRFFCDPFIDVDYMGVKNIRVAKFQSSITRVVFDLAESPPVNSIKEIPEGLLIVFWGEGLEEKKPLEKPIEKIAPKPAEKIVRKVIQPEKKILSKEKEQEKAVEAEKVTQIEEEPKPLTQEEEQAPEKKEISISMGILGGYHFMHSSHYQDIYGKSIISVGGETIVKFPVGKNDRIGVALGFIYIKDDGSGNYAESRLKITPLSFSVLYFKEIKDFSPYLGFGADYIYFSENSPESYDAPIYSKKIWGYNIQVGASMKLASSLSLKVYAKYNNAKFKEGQLNINIGGNEYGLGLLFNL